MNWEAVFVGACTTGEMDVIDRLIEEGIDINCEDNSFTGLSAACCESKPWVIDVVTKLITNGADVDHENRCGWNALDRVLAIRIFNLEVASLLLDCSKLGINRIANNDNDSNYLSVANTFESYKFLIDNGINVNHVYNNDETILDRVVNSSQTDPEIRDYLIQHGAKEYHEL